MAKRTNQGRRQDRKRVAGGQDYEVRYEVKKTGKSKAAVKRATKSAGPSRKKGRTAARKGAIVAGLRNNPLATCARTVAPIS